MASGRRSKKAVPSSAPAANADSGSVSRSAQPRLRSSNTPPIRETTLPRAVKIIIVVSVDMFFEFYIASLSVCT